MPWRRYDARNPMRSPSTLNRLRVCCARKSRHGTKLQSDSRRVSEAATRRRGRMAQVRAIWELASVLLGASSACPDEAQTSVIRTPALENKAHALVFDISCWDSERAPTRSSNKDKQADSERSAVLQPHVPPHRSRHRREDTAEQCSNLTATIKPSTQKTRCTARSQYSHY